MTSSYYQFYQSHFQNPNPNPNPNSILNDPQLINPSPSTSASAPPVPSYSSSDYSNHSSLYSANPDNFSPSPQPYYYPHLVSQPTPYCSDDQNQMYLSYNQSNHGFSFDPYPSASYTQPGASMAPSYEDQCGNSANFVWHGGNGARDSGAEFSGRVVFDDYGRPISYTDEKQQNELGRSSENANVISTVEMQQDVKDGVEKFLVRLSSNKGADGDMDVLFQIGLDGIRMLDPATSRTLRVYPFETVEKWAVLDPHTFAFRAKSSTDFEPSILLKSNDYTINSILDAVTAASIQLKEMGGKDNPSDSHMASEQPSEKKKGFADWVNLMKPGNEEKDHWVPDDAVTMCAACQMDFGAFVRKHHCRNCGNIFCDKCTQGRISLTVDEHAQPVRVCDQCMAEVTQRLVNAKEGSGKVAALESHKDLAIKLKEEMDKNQKILTGLRSDGSGIRMKEVACPTCTVHLQVQVPTAGSETIECSVCQHPFLVNAD